MRAAVLGSGNWGTVFAKVLVDAGNDATLWARRPEVARRITDEHVNPAYLPGIALPEALTATADVGAALTGADLVAIAIPSQSLRASLTGWAPLLPPEATIVSLMKGIELDTGARMTEVIAQVTGASMERIVVVSGPNLALEIAREQPTATVVACRDPGRAEAVQRAIAAPYVRPYTNADVIGCELGGAVKNVIAVAVGIAHGFGLGENSKASLITRGLAETARLGAELGADALTFAGLAGLGDLVATCFSPLSRNRTFGERLGLGETLEQAQEATHGQVAEGAKSCRSVLQLARAHGVDVPITQAVEAVCFRGLTPGAMLELFMARSRKSEM